MNRVKSFRNLAFIFMLPAAVWAAHAADQHAPTPAMASGAYAITFHVNAPSTVPDGATITCKASVTPNPSKPGVMGILPRRPQSVESYPGFATVSGSSANCSVRLPIAYVTKDSGNGAALSYEIEAFTSQGPAFKRTQQGIAVAYPETPSAANLNLSVNF